VVRVGFESTPVTLNDPALTRRVQAAFTSAFGADILHKEERAGMGAEDFAYFIEQKLGVPGAYFQVGGTPPADIAAEKAGGKPVPGHHSPFFRIDPKPAVTLGTTAMTVAVLDILKK
jgi:hippurate hydrolase